VTASEIGKFQIAAGARGVVRTQSRAASRVLWRTRRPLTVFSTDAQGGRGSPFGRGGKRDHLHDQAPLPRVSQVESAGTAESDRSCQDLFEDLNTGLQNQLAKILAKPLLLVLSQEKDPAVLRELTNLLYRLSSVLSSLRNTLRPPRFCYIFRSGTGNFLRPRASRPRCSKRS